MIYQSELSEVDEGGAQDKLLALLCYADVGRGEVLNIAADNRESTKNQPRPGQQREIIVVAVKRNGCGKF